MDPLPKPHELLAYYPEPYWWHSAPGVLNTLEGLYRRVVLRDHVSFIARASASVMRDGRSPRLLDVGCGSGTLLSLLKRRGFQVTGYESSPVAARIARAEGIEVILGLCLEEAMFSDNSFDVVTLLHVLEHVGSPRALLREVHRMLQPAGRVIVQVPNIDSWQFRMFRSRWYGLDVPRHLINYSAKALQRLLSDSGFRICRIRHFNLRDNAPALASSLLPSLDPLSRRARKFRTHRAETRLLSWMKHAAYLGAVAASYPFAVAESLASAGGTVMIEAEKA